MRFKDSPRPASRHLVLLSLFFGRGVDLSHHGAEHRDDGKVGQEVLVWLRRRPHLSPPGTASGFEVSLVERESRNLILGEIDQRWFETDHSSKLEVICKNYLELNIPLQMDIFRLLSCCCKLISRDNVSNLTFDARLGLSQHSNIGVMWPRALLTQTSQTSDEAESPPPPD